MSSEANAKSPSGAQSKERDKYPSTVSSGSQRQANIIEEQSKFSEALRPRSLPADGLDVDLSKKKKAKQKKGKGKNVQPPEKEFEENLASPHQVRGRKKPTARHQHQVRALATTHNHQELVRAARNHPATSLGFMYVCSIVKSSAADQCGLKCGDIVIQFGPLNKSNWTGLRDIPQLVHDNVKKVIPITVLRRTSCKRSSAKTYKRISLRAIPAQWSEGAVLGCVLNTWPPPLPVQHPGGPNLPVPLAPPFTRPVHPQTRPLPPLPVQRNHEHIDEMLAKDRQEAEADLWNEETFGNAPENPQLRPNPFGNQRDAITPTSSQGTSSRSSSPSFSSTQKRHSQASSRVF